MICLEVQVHGYNSILSVKAKVHDDRGNQLLNQLEGAKLGLTIVFMVFTEVF